MAVIFSDNFNRPDSTDLGPDWQEVSADFAIISNVLTLYTYSSPIQCVYTTQQTQADYAVQAFCHTNLDNKRTPGVFLRGVWNSGVGRYDCYYAYIYPRNQEVRLALYQDNVLTTLSQVVDTSIAADGSTGHTVRLEAQGNTLNVYLDGVLKISVTDSTLTSGGYCGVMAASVRTSIYWDDFVVEGFSSGTVYTEDVSTFIDAAINAGDVANYVESSSFTVDLVGSASDQQSYVDAPSFLIDNLISVADVGNFIDTTSVVVNSVESVLDKQAYNDTSFVLIDAGVSAADYITFIESVLLSAQMVVGVNDIGHYITQGSVTIDVVLAVTERLIKQAIEDILIVTDALLQVDDKQTFIERLSVVYDVTATADSIAHFIERLGVAINSGIAGTALQTFVERANMGTDAALLTNSTQRYKDTPSFAINTSVQAGALSVEETTDVLLTALLGVYDRQLYNPSDVVLVVSSRTKANDVAVLQQLPASYQTISYDKQRTVEATPHVEVSTYSVGTTFKYNGNKSFEYNDWRK